MATTVKLYNLEFNAIKTYLFATIFIAGNLLLPQLAHLVPNGGITFLPIYFFTLIAAYKFGIRVGLLTAILSPVLNHFLFGMPVAELLPVILIKSSLLAVSACTASFYIKKISFLSILLVILSYQLIGTGIEWIMVKDFSLAIQDIKIGYPGMLIQLFGGYFVLKSISKI